MMNIDLKHLAKCLRNDGNPDFTYIGQHFGETPGWGALADEVLRLSKINVQLVTEFNAMNQHGAKQDARIAQLEAVVAAGDGLADVVMGGSTRNVMERYATNYRAAKEAANG